ncbi:MAG: hypothetical protein PVJ38_07865, partial [Candidatus Bathyarchaeota archaeon]
MVLLNLILHCRLEELQRFFIGLLSETGFVTIHHEEWQDGFWVVGANAKRTSQLMATLMNLFIGYIRRNRIAIELDATKIGDKVKATLKCNPYLDVVDMQAPDEDPVE